MMRWVGAVGLTLVLGASAWVSVVHWLAHRGVANLAASLATQGLQLEVGSRQTAVFPPRVTLTGLSVAADDIALIGADEVVAQLSTASLLWPASVTINQLEVSGARLYAAAEGRLGAVIAVARGPGSGWPQLRLDGVKLEGSVAAGVWLPVAVDELQLTAEGGASDNGGTLWDLDARLADGGTLELYGELDAEGGVRGGLLLADTELDWLNAMARLRHDTTVLPDLPTGHLDSAAGSFRWDGENLRLDEVVLLASNVRVASLGITAAGLTGAADMTVAAQPGADVAQLALELQQLHVSNPAGPDAPALTAAVGRTSRLGWSAVDGFEVKRLQLDAPAVSSSLVQLSAGLQQMADAGRAAGIQQVDLRAGTLTVDLAGTAWPLAAVEGAVTWDDDTMWLALGGRSDDGGQMGLRVGYGDSRQRVELDVQDVPAVTLSAGLALLGAPAIQGGRADVRMAFRTADGQLAGESTVTLRDVELDPAPDPGQDTAGQDATGTLATRLPLALALLTGPDGSAQMTLPMAAPAPASPAQWQRVFADTLMAGAGRAAEQPFARLDGLVGGAGALQRQVGFEPGQAAPGDGISAQLTLLTEVLAQRPRLGLEIRGHYDPRADRHALAARQVRLHVALATRTENRFDTNPAPLDLGDAQVRDVLEEFGNSRLGRAAVTALATQHGNQRDNNFYTALRTALENNESVAASALESLASYRARAVRRALTLAGVAAGRVRVARSTQPAAGAYAALDVWAPPDAVDLRDSAGL